MSFLKKIPILFIRFYQVAISPHFRPACRFEPSCSNYALDAVNKYGAIKGCWLGIKRIFRCHPFGKSGYDPVK